MRSYSDLRRWEVRSFIPRSIGSMAFQNSPVVVDKVRSKGDPDKSIQFEFMRV